jgi:hypothetical protein
MIHFLLHQRISHYWCKPVIVINRHLTFCHEWSGCVWKEVCKLSVVNTCALFSCKFCPVRNDWSGASTKGEVACVGSDVSVGTLVLYEPCFRCRPSHPANYVAVSVQRILTDESTEHCLLPWTGSPGVGKTFSWPHLRKNMRCLITV